MSDDNKRVQIGILPRRERMKYESNNHKFSTSKLR